MFILFLLNYFFQYLNFLELNSLQSFSLTISVLSNKKRNYMSNEDKIIVSNKVPDWFKEVVCGIMLSDGTLRINGKNALMGIQQTHEELTKEIWQMCFNLKLVLSEIHTIIREGRKPVYSFQTLTLPYFTNLYNDWYNVIDGKRFKVLPSNIENLFTPLAFAFLIMGDGSWDKHGSRIIIHLNWFTLKEVQIIQTILLKKFNISSYLVQEFNSDSNRGYIIKIPNKEVYKVRELIVFFCISYFKI